MVVGRGKVGGGVGDRVVVGSSNFFDFVQRQLQCSEPIYLAELLVGR